MTPELWRELRDSFERAENLPPDEQKQFVISLRERNPALAAELESLLAARNPATSFLDSPAAGTAVLKRALSGMESAPPPPLLPQETVIGDRYELGGLLGEGGFGRVYSAFDRRLDNRKVVVKVLKLSQGEAPEKRFQQEVRALSRLDHPGIVGVTDSGRLPDGSAYLVMQYVQGRSLQEAIAEGPLERKRCLRLLCDMAEALSFAHQAGVLHRDLKPTNVIVRDWDCPDERAMLIDFGIARTDALDPGEFQTTTVVGSPQYMAPEQLLGRASQASDLYSLGAIAFEMCVGRKLLEYTGGEPSRAAVERALAAVAPPLPRPVAQAIADGVALDPQQRIASAADFARALHANQQRPRRWVLTASGACLLGLAAWGLMPHGQTPHPPARELSISLKRRSAAEGAPPQAIPSGEVLHKGDQLQIEIQAPEAGYIYAFDEADVPGQNAPRFMLLFPGAKAPDAEATPSAAYQRIPQSPTAWVDYDGENLHESLWVVWSIQPIAELEATRQYALPPSYGAIANRFAQPLAQWLASHSAGSPQPGAPLVSRLPLPLPN